MDDQEMTKEAVIDAALKWAANNKVFVGHELELEATFVPPSHLLNLRSFTEDHWSVVITSLKIKGLIHPDYRCIWVNDRTGEAFDY